MTQPAAQSIAGLVTLPYRRGAEMLPVPLGKDAGDWTLIPVYDFREYKARYGSDPDDPKYVLFANVDTGRDATEIEIESSYQGATVAAKVTIPAGAPAGSSFAIRLPAADASLRLKRLRQLPLPLAGKAKDNWSVFALLGNIAKLAWVIGAEKDLIRRHLNDVQAQRGREAAHGAGLDMLGSDLRVPRFPPREHSWDADTIAVYHLEDDAAGPVLNAGKRFGVDRHHGVNHGAQAGVPGKFTNGFAFPDPAAAAWIEVPTHAEFDIAANAGFTVEVFVKADAAAAPAPRFIIGKGPANAAGALSGAGWSLAVGGFHDIETNVRWELFDGVTRITLFADASIGDGKFHHVAGMLDRATLRARLFIDGQEAATGDLGALGAVANAVQPLRMGRSSAGHQFSGVLDEVRLSRAARSDFHPVLGEGDEQYRARLGIFEQWRLPAPGALLNTLNAIVKIGPDTDPFILIERDPPGASAVKLVRIRPASIDPGQSIDRDGNPRSREADVCGSAAADTNFREAFLLRHDHLKVQYGSDRNRLMQPATAAALNQMIALLGSLPGKLIIMRGFDPSDTGLHGVGRALVLFMMNVPPAKLALFAHRAGFDYVENRGVQVYASVAPGEKLAIAIETPVANAAAGVDVYLNQAIDLGALPDSLPATGQFQWGLIACGAGRAHFVAHPADPATLRTTPEARRRLRLVADAPGEITLRVQYTLDRRTVTGTRAIRIGIASLANNESIAANGDRKMTETAAVGGVGTPPDPRYLISFSDPDVDTSANANNQLMQIAAERPLRRLLALVKPLAPAGQKLVIVKSYDPLDAGLHKAGRALRLRHTAIAADKLGALAHFAGFGYVRRQVTEVYCSAAEDNFIEIARAGGQPLDDEVVAGTPIKLTARFTTLPADGVYNWSVVPAGCGKGSFDVVLQPGVTFTPQAPGLVALNLSYLERDQQSTFPYTFEVRLKPALDVPATVIPKHEYDLIMNVLNYFHPIGVEVVTTNIREHVVEVKDNLLNAFPGYTYPDFRS